MSKKLMLLAAGALAALAFTALPSAASAGEWEHHCTSTGGVAEECTGMTIAGGAAELSNDNHEPVSCTAVSGTASAEKTGKTGKVELSFTGCKETVTFFQFSCSNTATSGKITTNEMTSHNVYLEPNTAAQTKPGLLLTGANVTFECAGFAKKTVTGNIIGIITNPNCTSAITSETIKFEKLGAATGTTQEWEQVTTSGTFFDLISGPDPSDSTTSSQKGEGTITTKATQHIRNTCHV